MEGLGEIFTCILLYWLISAIKLAQTSPGVHMMTWNLCLHCNELPQQQRSARFTVEHSENSINKQSSSDWLSSCHIMFLVDYPDCTFLEQTIDKRKTLHTGYLISFCFWCKNVCECIWPRYSKDTVALQAPIWLPRPARPVAEFSVGCLHHNLLPLWMKRVWEGRRTLWSLISST